MSKVFNGSKFLDDGAVELKLSNGTEVTVKEVMPEVMVEISKLEEIDEKDSDSMKKILGKICNIEASKFDNIGMVEMKGAVDFLLENLFDMKPQS